MTDTARIRTDAAAAPPLARGPGTGRGDGSGRRRRPASSAPPRMKKFRERNLRVIGIVAAVVLVVAVLGSLNLSKLPFFSTDKSYRAEFANAAGLTSGEIVTVAGVRVGSIGGLSLHGNHVEIAFTVADNVHLGTLTSVAARVLTPIGQEYLAVAPAGPGTLSTAHPIPQSRTSIPDTLVGDLSTLSTETGQINIPQLVTALNQTTANIKGIPTAAVASALSGLARFSAIIGNRQQELSALVTSASNLSGVLATHSAQLVNLIGQADLVLKVLEQRRADIRALLSTTSSLGAQLTTLLAGNKSQLQSLLANLDTVSGILAHDSNNLGQAIPLLAAFSRYSANATGSGPFADFTLPTLLIPDNVIAQCAGKALTDPLQGCRV